MNFNQQQKEAYQKAAFLCSKSEKSSNKIKLKLIDWGLTEDESISIVEKLIEEKYINDERYASSFVRDKFRFNKWGKIKIAYHLKADRISSNAIDKALKEIDDSAYRNTLEKLLKEKTRKIKAVNQYDQKAKLFRFAQSRGFESDHIFSILDEILKA
ncbi:regulatory protein RecX [Sunxiuqinia sp. A32]|uniref:regulatory protein RecX n=1 Tax=Sunxiuqinia sp. A32 TaxID=3461496 RepID=UPI004045AB34